MYRLTTATKIVRAYYKVPDLRIQSAVICEDVRKEQSGKTILLGVYAGDMVFVTNSSGPFPTQKILWVQAECLSNESTMAEFQISYNDKELMTVKQESPSGKKGRVFAFPITRIGMSVEAPASLDVKFREPGGRWKKILRQPIKFQSSPPTASPPPS